MQGKKRASQVLNAFSERKVSKNQTFSGTLGIITNGAATVKVTNRDNFVWVRLRNASNEVIQAFNDSVSNTYDLPVLVEYDPHNPVRYRIIDRDVGRYQSWGGTSTQMPPHGWSHTFGPDGSGGGDITWVYSKQFMPFLVAPSGTAGTMGVTLYPHTYYYNDEFRYAGGTGTSSLAAYKPTGTSAVLVLISLELQSGNMDIKGGTEFFAATLTGTAEIIQYVPSLPTGSYIPLAAVRLLSGTSSLLWSNIYDLRDFYVHGLGRCVV